MPYYLISFLIAWNPIGFQAIKKSETEIIHHHLETDKPHLLFLTETQIRCPPDSSYLGYPGYSLEHNFRPKAGVCAYVRDDICSQRLRHLEDHNFSVLWIMIETSSEQIVYSCVYRSHSGDSDTTRLFNYLSETVDTVQLRFPSAQIVLLGDFNACHSQWLFPFRKTDHAGKEVFNFATSHNLTQLVTDATRIPDVEGHSANCLDLLMTTDPDRYMVMVTAPLGTSDHCLVKSVSTYSPPDLSTKGKRRVWRYNSADWDEMRHFFASYPWQQVCFGSNDPSLCAENVADVIRQGMEYYIPFSDVSISSKTRPWFNSKCATAERNKQVAYRNWADARLRKDPDISKLKKIFNRASKFCKKVLKEAHRDHIRHIGNRLSSYPAGSKAFWSLAKAVETNFSRPSFPPLFKPDGSLAHSAKEKADVFAFHFSTNSRLDPTNVIPPSIPHCGSLMPEIRIKQKEVLNEMRNLDVNKASGPDGIPAIVLKTCAPELSPILTRLFRLSFKMGVVPKAWKLANIQPVPKKGSRADPSNYRPISITSIICKIMERILNYRLLTHLESNDILNDRQYGFRKKRSTGDLLVHASHLWGEALENHGEALAVSLDISKAFDKVWHDSLINKLPSYGVPSTLSIWIADFLRERSVRVVVDGCASDQLAINAGVPQGSVLSATLFLLHINDMLKHNIFGYADDSTVVERYLSDATATKDKIKMEREAMVERVNRTLREVSDWGDSNLVQFNANKTQACLFTAKKCSFELTPSFQNVAITVADHLELLGVTLSSDLNFGAFIESKARMAAKKLGILSKEHWIRLRDVL
ncbi:unnamed protein product [Colias eurytheme]|nr:unnamed protein product [Colias eurytheme]